MRARSSKRRRSSDAQERFREAFLDQAGDQLTELNGLLQVADEDTILTASAELERLADTAGTLGLGQLERASRAAAHDLPGDRRMDTLRLVAQALRRTRGQPRLGPILVVAHPDDTQAIRDAADAIAEPIRLYPTMEAFTQALHVDEPCAVCLPMEAHDAIHQLSEYERFPVFAHGPPGAIEGIATAIDRGAVGYLQRPLQPDSLTRLVRRHTTAPHDAIEVFLLMDDGPPREALRLAIEALGIAVISSGAPSDLGTALDQGTADAIIVGSEVNGASCAILAQIVRGHPTRGHLPLMIFGRPKNPAGLRSAGIDDLMRANAEPHHVAQRVRDRVTRFLALPWTEHPTSRLQTRIGCLDALDALLRAARRSPTVIAVGMLQVDGLHSLTPPEVRQATRDLRRVLSERTQVALRRTDIVGELIPGSYLVVMPQADEGGARERLGVFKKALRLAGQEEDTLSGLSWRVGVADISLGLAGVASRAERDLA